MIAHLKEDHPEISERSLCRLFSVSRSWYYERPSVEEKARKDVELRDAIERIVLGFAGYGYRRVTAALGREGWSVNHKRLHSSLGYLPPVEFEAIHILKTRS